MVRHEFSTHDAYNYAAMFHHLLFRPGAEVPLTSDTNRNTTNAALLSFTILW